VPVEQGGDIVTVWGAGPGGLREPDRLHQRIVHGVNFSTLAALNWCWTGGICFPFSPRFFGSCERSFWCQDRP